MRICDRRRGVGADGLILLSDALNTTISHATFDDFLRMDFFNSDGLSAQMCGNGLRCAALFASTRMNRGRDLLFETDAGELRAQVRSELQVRIELPLRRMPEKISIDGKICFITDTGVPHLVAEVDNIEDFDVHANGKRLRNHVDLAPNGVNVNFVEFSNKTSNARIRTFERGVEGETQACGTGAAAAAVCAACFLGVAPPIDFKTAGGDVLTVDFSPKGGIVECGTNLSLTGPAIEVYTGELSLPDSEN
jgi:diaminopimelate epimerase